VDQLIMYITNRLRAYNLISIMQLSPKMLMLKSHVIVLSSGKTKKLLLYWAWWSWL